MAVAVIMPSMLVLVPISASAATEVCGLDGVTYSSAEAAEAAGVDVSYEFACTDPETEDGLYEATIDLHFNGMLVEIGSTDLPTTLVVRDNDEGVDYTVEVSEAVILGQRRDQVTKLSDWIPGDQIKVVGQKNENTEVIEASMLVNLSIRLSSHIGANGWITDIDKDDQTITYQWANKEHTFEYDDDTRFVSGLINPATVDDLEINDRIRGRLLLREGADPLAKIVVVLRRGENLFMKIRTFRPNAKVVEINDTTVPTTIKVEIMRTAGLRGDDVNNLIGGEGEEVTINVSEDTKIVRKYFGLTTLDEFSVGDVLSIVGRVNDDNTVDAKLLKNQSIWKTSTRGHAGMIVEVDADNNYFVMKWVPLKLPTKKMIEDAKAENPDVDIKKLIKRLPARTIKVSVTDDTQILIGTDSDASISDINEGDKVRVRATRTNDSFVADDVVVVNSLPELEEISE